MISVSPEVNNMRPRSKSILVPSILALLTLAAAPAFSGIHYKSTTHTESSAGSRGTGGNGDIQVEGWVSGDKARVEFKESGSPIAKQGSYLITKDGGKAIYLVDPEEKTYAVWDLKAMMGMVGGVMNGMGPLLHFEFTNPKVEKLLDEDGGMVAGLPTRHQRYRTSYTLTVKVLGMGNTSDVVTEQDIWSTQRLSDVGLGVWLRTEPPRTGNEQLDKLIASGREKAQGFPLKMVTVSTNTQQKKGRQTTTKSTMEVTQLDTAAKVADASFEIPAGYKETQMLPAAGGQEGEQGGIGGLFGRKKKPGGGGD
jgi:hypothetical protein